MRVLKWAPLGAALVAGGLFLAKGADGPLTSAANPWPAGVDTSVPENSPPLSPEEAIKTFTLAPGYALQLVANEPLVRDPILAEFDGDGRLWVLEMHGFAVNRNMDNSFEPINELVILEDTDRDGKFDKRTVFMDGLVMPRAFKILIDNCALIGEPPNLWKACDTDGDLVADTKELISEKFATQGVVEHGANGLYWSMDNTIVISQEDWNLGFQGGKFSIMPSVKRGQWGVTQDDAGRIYRNVNTDPLFVDYLKPQYYARNPNLVRTSGLYESLVDQEKTLIWPARPTVGINRGYRSEIFREDGSSTYYGGVSSPMIYRGTALPKEIQGQPLVVDGPTNLVHLLSLKDDGTGRLSATDFYDRGELIVSTDERFRPVSLTPGWDGTFYVIDMYRGVSQDGPLQTDYLRDYIQDRGLWEHINMGRIYRVIHDDMKTDEWPRMSSQTPAELVGYLAHHNGWWRDTAQQYLVQRGDKSVAPALREMARSANDARTRHHALWTLDGLGALDDGLVRQLLNDRDAAVRASAVRLMERQLAEGNSAAIDAVRALENDPQWSVRLQVAASLGAIPDPRKLDVLMPILQSNGGDPIMVDAIVSGLFGLESKALDIVLRGDGKKSLSEAVLALSAAIARSGDLRAVERLLPRAASSTLTAEVRTAILTGLTRGLRNTESRFTLVAGGRAGSAAAVLTPNQSAAASGPALRTRPSAVMALAQGDGPLSKPAADLLALVSWPGKPSAPPSQKLTAEQQARFNAGREIYANVCAACHQPTGRGAGTLATDLDGSVFVNGSPDAFARILLNGKEGSIGLMPPAGAAMSDDEVAAIITYVRGAWSNRATPVEPAAVKEWRQAYRHRQTPWTAEELGPRR